MNNINLVKFLAIIDKMQIERQPYLSKEEKEFFKQMVDEIKNQAEADFNQQQNSYKS